MTRLQKSCRRIKPDYVLGVVHLDVPALDVAGPGVDGVWATEELDGEAVPGDECRVVRAARLTLVEHQNGESAGQRGRQRRVLGPVGAVELGRIQEDLRRRLAVGGGEDDGINNAVKPDRRETRAPSTVLVPVS